MIVKLVRADFDGTFFSFCRDVALAIKFDRQLIEDRVTRICECKNVFVTIDAACAALQLERKYGNFGGGAGHARG